MKVCATPGCPALTEGTTHCPTHTQQRRQATDQRRPTSNQRGYGPAWRRKRADYLRYHPLCEWPDGCITPATDVHHRDGQGPTGPQGYTDSNLQALCHTHHSQITAKATGWGTRTPY